MTNEDITTIIRKVLSTTENVVAQLKEEKKSTGDYSKSITLQDGDLQMRFNALEYCGKYPPISVNLLKREALDKLLENCRAEFCYGDHRVENYKEEYLILGEEVIDKIYKEYLTWLKENCTTFAQDASSGEFTGIAIDWQGKEDQQPLFDID